MRAGAPSTASGAMRPTLPRTQIEPHPVELVAEAERRRVLCAGDRAAVIHADVERLGDGVLAEHDLFDRPLAHLLAVDPERDLRRVPVLLLVHELDLVLAGRQRLARLD